MIYGGDNLEASIDEYIPTPNPYANTPLLRKAVEWVEEQSKLDGHLREWVQQEWLTFSEQHECGTVMCVAGKVALMCGWEQVEDSMMVEKEGQCVGVQSAAEYELGINGEESFLLFRASNTASDVRRIAEAIAGERL